MLWKNFGKSLGTENVVENYYRSQTKLWEGNVFTGVSHSVPLGQYPPPSGTIPLTPGNHKSRRHASY